jgi:hypothetical protein
MASAEATNTGPISPIGVNHIVLSKTTRREFCHE